MLPLTNEQQSVFDRFDVKATSMGLTRVGDLTQYWMPVYQVIDGHRVSIGCNCDPNIYQSPVNIGILVPIPSTGTRVVYEHKTYSIEEFEKIKAEDLKRLSTQVEIQTNEVVVLEAKLKDLRKSLHQYVKKALR